MRIMGIDPGYDRLGIAVVEKLAGKKETLVYSDCFRTHSKDLVYARLLSIGKEIGRVLDGFRPNALALETLFVTKNQKTAMRVAEARGIIIYETSGRDIPIHEYSPVQIKAAVTGDGRSDKAQVAKMVGLSVALPAGKNGGLDGNGGWKPLDDEYDAVAAALACLAIESRNYPQAGLIAKNLKP